MSEGLNMSLDDLIKNNKKSGASSCNSRPQGQGQGRDRDRGTGPGPGPVRRFANRGPPRPTPYIPPQAIQLQEPYIGGGPDTGEGTKLYISNLESGVSNEDIKVLFSEVGELKRYSIHYDRSGRSKGTAEVVFVRQSDALAALKRYNNLQLDGKPMNIELVGMNLVTPVLIPPTSRGILGNPVGPSQRFDSRQERAAGRGWDRRSSGGPGFGRSRRQGRATNEKLSIEDLDADLENYRLEAMQIN